MNGFGPFDNDPRHRLLQTYEWLNFKACMVMVGWGLILLVVLVIAVMEGR